MPIDIRPGQSKATRPALLVTPCPTATARPETSCKRAACARQCALLDDCLTVGRGLREREGERVGADCAVGRQMARPKPPGPPSGRLGRLLSSRPRPGPPADRPTSSSRTHPRRPPRPSSTQPSCSTSHDSCGWLTAHPPSKRPDEGRPRMPSRPAGPPTARAGLPRSAWASRRRRHTDFAPLSEAPRPADSRSSVRHVRPGRCRGSRAGLTFEDASPGEKLPGQPCLRLLFLPGACSKRTVTRRSSLVFLPARRL